jgi:hypothetical protein
VPENDDEFRAKLLASRQRLNDKKAITPAAQKPLTRRKAPPPEQPPVVDVHRLDNLQSPEAEMGVVGSMITEPEKAIPVVLTRRVSRWEFFNPVHRVLFQAVLDMYDSGEKVDLVTITQHLRDQKVLDSVGGAAYVTQLFAFVPTSAAIDYYIDILLEKRLRRDLYNLSCKMGRAAVGITEQDSDELLSQFAGQYEQMFRLSKQSGFADAAHLLNGQLPAPPIQIVRHIVHRGSKLILSGGSKTQKTWSLMALALAVSTGTDWWGFHTHKSRVCYINLELQDWSFHERLVAVAEKTGVKPDEGWLQILNLRGYAQSIEDLRRHFAMMLKSGFFALVIIDPIYKVLGRRDENKAGDIATLLNEVDRITVDVNAAVAMAAHFSKGNQSEKESIDRIGGSGVFARDPDSILTMTAHEDVDCFTVQTTLRNLPPISSFVVRWEYPLFLRDEEKNPQSLRGKGGRDPKWTEKDVLDEMHVTETYRTTKLQKMLKEERNMSQAKFYVLWEQLKKDGKIKVDDEGLWHKTSLSESNSKSDDSDESEESPSEFKE